MNDEVFLFNGERINTRHHFLLVVPLVADLEVLDGHELSVMTVDRRVLEVNQLHL